MSKNLNWFSTFSLRKINLCVIGMSQVSLTVLGWKTNLELLRAVIFHVKISSISKYDDVRKFLKNKDFVLNSNDRANN